MTFATERELQLTRELLQARIQGSQTVIQAAQMQLQLLSIELRALPEKWEAPVAPKKVRK